MSIILLLAFVCYRIHLVDQDGNRCVSNLLLLVVNPCVVLTVYQTDYDPRLVRLLGFSFVAAFASHVLAILISNVFVKKKDNPDYAIERFNAIYSNCGFIGIPLIDSVLGSDGVFFLTAYIVIFNIFIWTHGILLMEHRFSFQSLKRGLLSSMFISTIVALVLFFLQIRIPSVLLEAMDYVAGMNTPLAMMVAGFSVAQSDLKEMIRKFRLYYVSFVKLILVPLLMIPILWIMKLPHDVAVTILIATACPAATTGTMMAIRYKQNYTYSSEIFAMSTVLSILTIPVIVSLGEMMFAIG